MRYLRRANETNKYDELLGRAKMFYDQPMVGELMNAVRELKERPEVVRRGECSHCVIYKGIPICNKWRTLPDVDLNDFCSYGERKENG